MPDLPFHIDHQSSRFRVTRRWLHKYNELSQEDQGRVREAVRIFAENPLHPVLRLRQREHEGHVVYAFDVSPALTTLAKEGDPPVLLDIINLNDTSLDEWFAETNLADLLDDGLSRDVAGDALLQMLNGPIEEWMIFLHPDQEAMVERTFQGPARISGSAGTGKTVVGIHRALRLASGLGERELPILFTTFVRSLSDTHERMYQRLAVAGQHRVEFATIGQLAYRVVSQLGESYDIDDWQARSTLRAVLRDLNKPDTPLGRLALSFDYLYDEIERVIKGRMIRSLEEYLNIERHGRLTPFQRAHREQMWNIYQEYCRRMREQGKSTYADVTWRAYELACEHELHWFSRAIIDEVQDFTLAQLMLVSVLSGMGEVHNDSSVLVPNSLLMIGDAAQKIYPGGFTLREAGIDIRGNAVVFRTNYRNSREIIEFAMACTGHAEVQDFDERFLRASASRETERRGVLPVVVRASNIAEEGDLIANTIKSDVLGDNCFLSDMAVLAFSGSTLKSIEERLTKAGVAFVRVNRNQRRPGAGVRTLTFHQVKGREFKVVFVVGMNADHPNPFPRLRGTEMTDTEYEEQLEGDTSLLHVALTRPRDRLFVSYSCEAGGEMSHLIRNGLDLCEHVSTEEANRRCGPLRDERQGAAVEPF